MKKMSISKRGFTLTEIIVVVAIMVIVASAAFVGIAVTINRANDTSARLQRENGNNFEKDAWTAVDSITEGAAKFFDISNYKPKVPTNTPVPTATPTPVPTQAPVNTPVPTKAASNTNTPVPTNTPKPTTAPAAGSKPEGISNLPGNVSAGSSSSVSVNVGDARDWGQDSRRIKIGGSKPVYKVKVKVDGNSTSLDDIDWRYKIEPAGNGVYEITYKANDNSNKPINGFEFNFRSDKNSSSGKVTIESVDYYNE
jgi:prepilin-type N-terminal cleavage/methylation domain-containing protein